jgi:transposase
MWLENAGSSSADVVAIGQRYGGHMLVRYRYRAYPTLGQVVLQARVFGCLCEVFDDALRTRGKARAAGVRSPRSCWCGRAGTRAAPTATSPRWSRRPGICHRRVVRVSRWVPCSQLCSARGLSSGKTRQGVDQKSLDVRSWTCPSRGIGRDHDLFAAKNVCALGREVAAGLAETRSARGGSRGSGRVVAAADEARTHRGAA